MVPATSTLGRWGAAAEIKLHIILHKATGLGAAGGRQLGQAGGWPAEVNTVACTLACVGGRGRAWCNAW
jgi:hypothetical protein